jgi:hypothetical protein
MEAALGSAHGSNFSLKLKMPAPKGDMLRSAPKPHSRWKLKSDAGLIIPMLFTRSSHGERILLKRERVQAGCCRAHMRFSCRSDISAVTPRAFLACLLNCNTRILPKIRTTFALRSAIKVSWRIGAGFGGLDSGLNCLPLQGGTTGGKYCTILDPHTMNIYFETLSRLSLIPSHIGPQLYGYWTET